MKKKPFARHKNTLAKSAEKLTFNLFLIKLFMVAFGICSPSIFNSSIDFTFFIISSIFFIGPNFLNQIIK